MQADARHLIARPRYIRCLRRRWRSLCNVNREDAIRMKSDCDQKLSRICDLPASASPGPRTNAQAMLRAPDARVLDVAVACGFKTQQHFAQVFRDVCGISPTGYRQDLVGSEATCASETCSEDTPRLVICGSQPELHSHGLLFTSLLTSSPVRNL